jgi:hypothetical protein
VSVTVEDAINPVIAASFPALPLGTFDHTDRCGAFRVLGKDDLCRGQSITDTRGLKILLLGRAFTHDEGDGSGRLLTRLTPE